MRREALTYALSRRVKHAQQFLVRISALRYQAHKMLPDCLKFLGGLARVRRKFIEALTYLTEEQRRGPKAAV